MKLIQCPPTKYNQTGYFDPITIREWRGVNTFDPLSIEDGFFTDMSNMTTDDYPAISVRPGFSVVGNEGTKVLGIGVWEDKELHVVFNDGTWRRFDGTTWSTLKSGLNTSATWSFTSFQGNLAEINLIGANGVDGLHRYDGSTVQTFGDAPTDINFITTYKNRLWGASKRDIRACYLNKPDKWNEFNNVLYGEEVSYAQPIESIRGENINMLYGGLTYLVIGFPNSVRELYGSTPPEFNDRLISDDEGFSNNNAEAARDGELKFIHSTGIYAYSGGILPDRTFSDIVKRYLTSITNQSAAGSDGKRMYFSLPSSTTLVYDPREGIGAWSVWKDISPNVYAVMNNELYIGDNQGRILKLGGADDAGTPINWYAVTKPFTNRSVAQKQRWLKLWIMAELAAGSTLNISLSRTVDGNDWEQVQTFTGTGQHIERIIVPVANYALENTIRVKFSGTGWARIHELTRQIRQLPLY